MIDSGKFKQELYNHDDEGVNSQSMGYRKEARIGNAQM